MNEAVPDSQARPDWQSRARAAWPLRQLPLDVVPPLASLSALAALVSMVLNQLVLPALGAGSRAGQFPKLAQTARFSANLAVTAGLITLLSSIAWALVGRPRLPLRSQLCVFVAGGTLIHIALAALLFDPLGSSRSQIYFGVVAANAIGMAAGAAALSSTRGAFLRALALGMTLLAALNLATVMVELVPDAQLDPWTHRATVVCKGGGEIVYLLLLIASFPLLVPRSMRMRALLARSIGFAVLVLAFYAQLTAQHALKADYSLLVYSAQRVSLLLDRSPLLYAVPFCMLLSSTATGLLIGEAIRVQAAAGLLLIFASGYATRAPGRLLSLAVGFMLFARALIALTEHAPFRSIAPPPKKSTAPPSKHDS